MRDVFAQQPNDLRLDATICKRRVGIGDLLRGLRRGILRELLSLACRSGTHAAPANLVRGAEQHPDLVAEMMLDDLFQLGVSHAPAALSHGQSNPGLATVGELHASGFENLTNAGDGAGPYFFASLEANDCLASDPGGGR
jgi:hypothetical protein